MATINYSSCQLDPKLQAELDKEDEASSSDSSSNGFGASEQEKSSVLCSSLLDSFAGNVGVGFAGDRLLSRRSTQHAPDLDNFTCPSSAYCPGVSEEIKGLFQYIDRYQPQEVDIGTILKPFIPDFLPAIGTVDEFLKVPRPDGLPDFLGLKVLGEDGPTQSDPAVLTLQLRNTSMHSSIHIFEVASIENCHKNPKKLDAWINSIKDLHHAKPPPSVVFSKPMPDIEKLMQVWPPQMETILETIELPKAHLDVDLATLIDICCSILDIPVYTCRVESLHVLFSLYIQFKFTSPSSCTTNWSHRFYS
ncbi:unnamed protein product [Sphagnum troendelagicum]|uniref:Intraflagellar transport protein 46 homolog n=1 Tax=Sphagnum troendelagicum TaxID=128251 RepID=A0ABP0T985_9BRYO